MADKTRITLDLSPAFYAHLEALEARTGAESKAQVIREALKLYGYLVDCSLAGDTFVTRHPTGHEETVVFLGSAFPQEL